MRRGFTLGRVVWLTEDTGAMPPVPDANVPRRRPWPSADRPGEDT